MDITHFSIYRFIILRERVYRAQRINSERQTFLNPDTVEGLKLYLMLQDAKVIYVGITNRPMRERIQYGLTASGVSGYYGYHWKNNRDPMMLLVWTFDGEDTPDNRYWLETVEAEIAYLIRNRKGNWPESQTEIHFHQSQDEHRRISRKLLNKALKVRA